MSYRGDWLEGQNRFRRLMLQHFTPKSHPPLELMPVAASVHGMIGFNDTTEANLVRPGRRYRRAGSADRHLLARRRMERGRLPTRAGKPARRLRRVFHGVLLRWEKRPATAGMRFLAWFEPERAMRGTWLEREHADWLLAPSGTPDGAPLSGEGRLSPARPRQASGPRLGAGQYFQGHPRVRASPYTGRTSICIPRSSGTPMNRPDKTGLREVRYISGLYEFLDELARRHPGLILDNCASGGRRLDFEMMRRCVALWRSDSCWDDRSFPRNVQAMTHGLSHLVAAARPGRGRDGCDRAAQRHGRMRVVSPSTSAIRRPSTPWPAP